MGGIYHNTRAYREEIASTFQLHKKIMRSTAHPLPPQRAMSDSTFLMYLLALAGAFLLPGPDMALVLATGAARGVATALVTALGIAGARAVHVALSGAGLAALMVTHPQALQWVKWAGAAYLLYLALRLLQSALSKKTAQEEAAPATAHGARASLVRGFLTNLLNPKALLFCSMFLPQFVSAATALACNTCVWAPSWC